MPKRRKKSVKKVRQALNLTQNANESVAEYNRDVLLLILDLIEEDQRCAEELRAQHANRISLVEKRAIHASDGFNPLRPFSRKKMKRLRRSHKLVASKQPHPLHVDDSRMGDWTRGDPIPAIPTTDVPSPFWSFQRETLFVNK